MRIARAALHQWEEPVISGVRGSGAIFFTGCNLKCIFCQNAAICENGIGREISPEALADMFFLLEGQGAHNINLVTPTHFAPGICEAINIAKGRGFKLPFIYNSSGYESVETLKMLEGLIDVYLPDFKYLDEKKATAYSGAGDYPEAAKAAIAEMYRQVGKPVMVKEAATAEPQASECGMGDGNHVTAEAQASECGMGDGNHVTAEPQGTESSADGGNAPEEVALIKRGLIVRHLVLPLGVKNACRVIDYLAETYGDNIYISIMNQYTPLYNIPGALREEQKKRLEAYKELQRKVTGLEYDRVVQHVLELGLENVFIQEDDASGEMYIPDWNCF
ncbi:MAG: radical SAM protein [Lachnospiraceae bacterium]|nr:radical SAM protein [Lachnospiraceae bacterium]